MMIPLNKKTLSTKIVREFLNYDQHTGFFMWKARSRDWFSREQDWKMWNTRYAERVAGKVHKDKTGYPVLQIKVLGKLHIASRLAFLWMGEELPEQVDHDDGDSLNQRWDNLLASNHAENGRNQSMSRNNTSGVSGVCWHKAVSKWQAGGRLDGKTKHLGYFNDINEAAAAVSKFHAENGYTARHGQEFSPYQRIDNERF